MNSLYQLPSDIREEFTVEDDGKVWASARATARLAGINVSSLIDNRHGLLRKLKHAAPKDVVTKVIGEHLEPFIGFDYWLSGKIPDVLVSALVAYYAYESKNANEHAKQVAGAMQAVGTRTWFKQVLGYTLKQPETNPEILKVLSDINQRLSGVENSLVARIVAENHHLGIANIVQNLATKNLLPPAGLSEPFTAREYALIVHGRDLCTSESISLGRFASDVFTAIDQKIPDKAPNNRRLYYHRDPVAWETIYATWLANR